MGETFSIHLDKVTDAVLAAIPNASFTAMTHMHTVAIERTPLQDGNLRGESYVEANPHGADVVYPGPYARYQHYEILKHLKGGERLYLEKSVLSETPKVLEILTQELCKVIE